MAMSRRRAAWTGGLLVVALVPLVPAPPAPVHRDADQDLALVRSAEVRYRGITATFDEVTRAYALSAYVDPQLEGWTARAYPRSPETEALITARFRVAGVRADSVDPGEWAAAVRRRTGSTLEVTWRLNTLAAVQVQPHDDYARDALRVFRQTVARILERLVYVIDDVDLCDTPEGIATARVAAGSVLMREAGEGLWVRVRVPSDTTVGWVPGHRLRPVYTDPEPP